MDLIEYNPNKWLSTKYKCI